MLLTYLLFLLGGIKEKEKLIIDILTINHTKIKNIKIKGNIVKLEVIFDTVQIKALQDIKNAIIDSENLKDFVSRDIFRSILDSEEEHVDVIETRLGLANKIGKENWLQSQL